MKLKDNKYTNDPNFMTRREHKKLFPENKLQGHAKSTQRLEQKERDIQRNKRLALEYKKYVIEFLTNNNSVTKLKSFNEWKQKNGKNRN